jgi:hypothetical protein
MVLEHQFEYRGDRRPREAFMAALISVSPEGVQSDRKRTQQPHREHLI